MTPGLATPGRPPAAPTTAVGDARARRPVAVAALLAVLCLALHGRALAGTWQFDDGAHLYYALRYAPWQYFFVPEVMFEQTDAYIAPWNAFFYELGLPLFGLAPFGHLAHLLVVLWAIAVSTVRLLERWTDGGTAFSAGALFLAMPPTAIVACSPTTGHYAYGLLFSVLAVHGFAGALSRDSARPPISVAVLYALACSCKEIYVPLPAVLLVLPLRGWTTRVWLAWPSIGVAAAYGGLRIALLGGLGGMAYQPPHAGAINAGPNAPWLAQLVGSLTGLNYLLLGFGACGWLALGVVVIVAARGWRSLRGATALFWLTCAGGVLLPLVPMRETLFVGDPMQGRIVFVVGWGVAVLVSILLSERAHRLGAALFLGALLASGQWIALDVVDARNGLMQAHNRFVLDAGADQVLLPDPQSHVGPLQALVEAVALWSGRPPTAIVTDDEALASLGAERGRAAWTWDEAAHEFRRLGLRYDTRVDEFHRQVAAGRGRPFEVELSLEDRGRHKVLGWSMAGGEGQASLHVRELGTQDVPNQGKLPFVPSSRLLVAKQLHVRASFRYPDGSIVRSPVFAIDTTRSTTHRWAAPTLEKRPPGAPGER